MSASNPFVCVVLATALASSACGVEPATMPSPFGPAELALSLELAASPDVISQDGVSTSRVNIVARGPSGQPVSALALRVDVMVPTDAGMVVADFGSLSDRWPTTGADGRVAVVYRAPPHPPVTATSDVMVTIRATPIGANYASTVPRVVNVQLVRPGVIRPPTRMVPRFTHSPTTPREHDAIFFDASSSQDPDGQIASYFWQFGDGDIGAGRQTSHSYELAGNYGVTLTVTDSYGTSVTTAVTTIAVATSAAPTARFTMSPTNPQIGTRVSFNAAASTAALGRRLVAYNWDLGDDTDAEGMAVAHSYTSPGTYTVVLVVTDDGGRKGVIAQTVTVADLDSPVASFTVSPTDAPLGTVVVLNASPSTVAPGRTIVSYSWNFGDNTPDQSGLVVTHVFEKPGTYTVVLTVMDSAGRKGVASTTVTIIAVV